MSGIIVIFIGIILYVFFWLFVFALHRVSVRVRNIYDLMNPAPDAAQINSISEQLDHKPIIDHNAWRGEKINMDLAAKVRFAQRSSTERVNSHLKDNYGCRQSDVSSDV